MDVEALIQVRDLAQSGHHMSSLLDFGIER